MKHAPEPICALRSLAVSIPTLTAPVDVELGHHWIGDVDSASVIQRMVGMAKAGQILGRIIGRILVQMRGIDWALAMSDVCQRARGWREKLASPSASRPVILAVRSRSPRVFHASRGSGDLRTSRRFLFWRKHDRRTLPCRAEFLARGLSRNATLHSLGLQCALFGCWRAAFVAVSRPVPRRLQVWDATTPASA